MRTRLSVLYFLQFAVWGCYLTCFGQLLGAGGLGSHIAWFYAAIGIVSIITPALMGHLADRYVRPDRLLAFCHAAAAIAMLFAWHYASSVPVLSFSVFFPLYLLFLAFYMPTMALANTVSFSLLKTRGILPVDAFPAIRVWGTVGFVAASWIVNSLYLYDGTVGFTLSDSHPASHFRFQYTSMQLLCSSLFGFLTALYALSLPPTRHASAESAPRKMVSVFRLSHIAPFFRNPVTRMFLVFAALSGVCLQISNGFATPFITHFIGIPQFSGDFASSNATMLFSLSQIAEAVCLLLVGIALKRWGIRVVFALGLSAWALRFFFFAFGNPGDGLWMLVSSMIVYGIAFNFITIAGHLFIEQQSDSTRKGLGQGVMMLMSNGLGATVGTVCAGALINRWCQWQMVNVPSSPVPVRLFMGEWSHPWLIFAAYTLLVALLWLILFRPRPPKSIR